MASRNQVSLFNWLGLIEIPNTRANYLHAHTTSGVVLVSFWFFFIEPKTKTSLKIDTIALCQRIKKVIINYLITAKPIPSLLLHTSSPECMWCVPIRVWCWILVCVPFNQTVEEKRKINSSSAAFVKTAYITCLHTLSFRRRRSSSSSSKPARSKVTT